jgi:hypothetical protein
MWTWEPLFKLTFCSDVFTLDMFVTIQDSEKGASTGSSPECCFVKWTRFTLRSPLVSCWDLNSTLAKRPGRKSSNERGFLQRVCHHRQETDNTVNAVVTVNDKGLNSWRAVGERT